jgi:hypothetical protein
LSGSFQSSDFWEVKDGIVSSFTTEPTGGLSRGYSPTCTNVLDGVVVFPYDINGS